MAIDHLKAAGPATDGDRSPDVGDRSPVLTGTVVPGPVRDTPGTGPKDQEESVYADILGDAIVPRYKGEIARRDVAGAIRVAAAKVGTGAVATAKCGWVAARFAGYGSWHGSRWFGAGFWNGAKLGWRYIRAHDRIEDLGGTQGQNWRRVADERTRRRHVLYWWAGILSVGDLLSWWALDAWGNITALDPLAYATAPSAEVLVAASITLAYGRYRLQRELPSGQYVDPADLEEEDPDEPFPISHATNADEASECLSRALHAESIGAREIRVLSRPDYGWELDVLLRGSKPADVLLAADDLEAHMHLPPGGCMAEPSSDNRSRLTMRLVQNDPFAKMPRPTVHAPRSLSVHDLVTLGIGMDGTPLELSFDGFCALVVGAMGAGKTLGALRTYAEALTACYDAVCWDLDPIKGGLDEFGDLMEKRGRGNKECAALLRLALSYIPARAKIKTQVGMGDRWHATAEHPNLYIFIDEFLQFPQKLKDVAIQILRLGRQYGIYLIFAAQEATSDALGDAIAILIAWKIMMACRFEDIKIALGVGSGAQGWRPDRMRPAVGPVVNDAGQAFVQGGSYIRPIRWRHNAFTRDQITNAIPERLAAGMPHMDADTIRAAGTPVNDDGQALSLVDQLTELEEPDADYLASLIEVYAKHATEFMPTAMLTEHLVRTSGWQPGTNPGLTLGQLIKRYAPDAAATKGTWNGVGDKRGWDLAPILEAAENMLPEPE